MTEWDAGGAETGDRLRRASYRLLPRDPDHAIAVGFEQCLALGVVLSRQLVVVPGAAVRLHDDAIARPAKVRDDLPTVQEHLLIDIRMFEAAAEEEVEHDVLQDRASRRGTRRDDPGELPRS